MNKLAVMTAIATCANLPLTAQAAPLQETESTQWKQEEQIRYLAGVKLAGQDLLSGQHYEPTDPLELAGYRDGLTRGQRWLADHPVEEGEESVMESSGPSNQTPSSQATSNSEAPADESAGIDSGGTFFVDQREETQPAVATTIPASSVDDHDRYATLPQTMSQRQFIDKIAPAAIRIGQKYDLYPSVMIAQAALESNWGNSDLAQYHHNLFGIKGVGVMMPTNEHLGGKDVTVTAGFRSYGDISASLVDYAEVLEQSLYRGVHRSNTSNYRQATASLTGTYATDPNYQVKLNQLIESYNLDQYDHQSPGDATTPAEAKLSTTPLKETKATSGERSSNDKNAMVTQDAPAKASGVPWPVPIAGGAGSVGLLAFLRRIFGK